MKSMRYISGVSLLVFLSTSTFTQARILSDFQEMQGQQLQRAYAKSLHTQQLVKSFYRIKTFEDVVNVATGKVLTEKGSPPQVLAEKVSPPKAAPLQSPHVYLVEELETLRIPRAMAAAFSHSTDKTEARKIVEQFDAKWEKYKLGEEDPDLPRSAAISRSNFKTELENWPQIILQAQKLERHRPQAQDLADEFKKARDFAAELKKDKSSVYDVVLKRENSPRSHITPSSYIGPEEVMPPEKRTRAINREEWDNVWGVQSPGATPKRKWAVRSEEWNEKKGSQDPSPSKKRKLDF